MLHLRVDSTVLADCIRRAVSTWITRSGSDRKAIVRVEGDGVFVELSREDASGGSSQLFRFQAGTQTISIRQVEASGAATPAEVADFPDDAFVVALQEQLARADGLIAGTTDPLEDR